MSQRTALITGGAKRVGRAITESLFADGFEVAITYSRSAAEAQSLCKSLITPTQRAIAIQADFFDPESAVQQIQKQFPFDRLDVLINNASTYESADLAATDLTLIRRLSAVHFESPLLLCRAMSDRLRTSNGSIINMIDLMIEHPMPKYIAYAATKAALANLTLSLARELAPQVTVNGIAPGVVDWPPDFPESAREKYLERVPLARPGSPADVASLVQFLVNEGRYITGQIIRLDGGRSIT
jgi:pteridine reductase